jgi:hypothetical protein
LLHELNVLVVLGGPIVAYELVALGEIEALKSAARSKAGEDFKLTHYRVYPSTAACSPVWYTRSAAL